MEPQGIQLLIDRSGHISNPLWVKLLGDLQPIASITGLDSNADKILFDLRRVSNGSDWQTAELKIQREVDVTHMGYVSFGHGDTSAIGFGYDTTEYFSMKTAVAEKAFTISAGALEMRFYI